MSVFLRTFISSRNCWASVEVALEEVDVAFEAGMATLEFQSGSEGGTLLGFFAARLGLGFCLAGDLVILPRARGD